MRYYVEGLTNVHGGEGTVRRIGEYATLKEAIEASASLIDAFLSGKFDEGMTVAELFFHYQHFGEVPFIFSDAAQTMNVSEFNHFKYAMIRCTQICSSSENKTA